MWVGLAQVLVVVLGFVALGVILKFNGWPDAPFMKWSPLSVGLRQHGMWLLLLPFFWTCYAVAASYVERGILSLNVAIIVGVVIAGIIFLAFLVAVATPGTRGMLMHFNPTAS